MNPYAVIKPRQQHILRPQSRQVSLKVKPNTQINGKFLLQPRASVAFSQYCQNGRQEDNKNIAAQIPHVINISNRRMRGFKVQFKNGQIVSKKNYQIQQKADLTHPQIDQAKVEVQIQNSLQLIVKQRQSDEFMFKLQPHHSSTQAMPVTMVQNAGINSNNAVGQKKLGPKNQIKTQNYGVTIQQVKSNEYIIVENATSKEYIQQYKSEQNEGKVKVISKQVKRYQIEQNFLKEENSGQLLKSPQKLQKSRHKHPIFTNPNAQFFQESVVLADSAAKNNESSQIQNKYSPVHYISSPPIQKLNAHEQSYYLRGKVQEKSFYLANQNGQL